MSYPLPVPNLPASDRSTRGAFASDVVPDPAGQHRQLMVSFLVDSLRSTTAQASARRERREGRDHIRRLGTFGVAR